MHALALKQTTSSSPSVGRDAATENRAEAFRVQFMYEFDEEEDLTLACKVKEYMDRKGWNRSKLAIKACLEPNVCYRIIRGENKRPRMETIISLSLATWFHLGNKERLCAVRFDSNLPPIKHYPLVL